jgi:hypothetical protein
MTTSATIPVPIATRRRFATSVRSLRITDSDSSPKRIGPELAKRRAKPMRATQRCTPNVARLPDGLNDTSGKRDLSFSCLTTANEPRGALFRTASAPFAG